MTIKTVRMGKKARRKFKGLPQYGIFVDQEKFSGIITFAMVVKINLKN